MSYPRGPAVRMDFLMRRTAAQQGAFFLQHLRSGMSLLDCGCGPGTITMGFAAAVAPGRVVGIDSDPEQVEAAKRRAEGVSTVTFEVGDINELPCSDSSFDAAFAHALFGYLADPVKAAREVYRVLRPGGLFGIRDSDADGTLVANSTPTLELALELRKKRRALDRTDITIGRRHASILRQAGFSSVESSASYENFGTPEAVRWRADAERRVFEDPHMVETATRLGWADHETLERIRGAWSVWGEHPDSFIASSFGEAVGWKE